MTVLTTEKKERQAVAKKSFITDFHHLLELLERRTPFAFNRFSDGELFILQNKELILGDNLIKIGTESRTGPYKPEDFKHYNPSVHGYYRDRLVEAFCHRQENYFKGLSCQCCVGKNNFKWQLDMLSEDSSDKFLTWANLFVNGNYGRFISEMFPLFSRYPGVFVCNEAANLSGLDFIKKDFRVGYNAMINDYGMISQIADWIRNSKIEGYLFLFSASTFSKLAIHQLFREFPKNTYLDVGTTLNGFINMSTERQYLGDFWYEKESPADTFKVCRWT